MTRLAILTAGSSTHTKGIMNFVCEEYRQLKKKENESFQVYLFMIRIKESWLLRLAIKLIKGKVEELPPDDGASSFERDGVVFNNIWIKESFFSWWWRTRIAHSQISDKNFRKVMGRLRGYSYILTHKTISQYVGMRIYYELGIPFGAFWHGSELSTIASENQYSQLLTKQILESSHDNFFVSKWLLQKSKAFSSDSSNNHVIYTGPSDLFYNYSPEQKSILRTGYGVSDEDIVVAYAGNLIPIKNVLLLPSLFQKIAEKCPNKHFKFWIIGNGELEVELREALIRTGLDFKMHGKVSPSKMPDFMNCINVLLLISKNEGLGLVCLEAMRCGAIAFGSLVGGIPEVIGNDYCVTLDDDFINNLSEKIVDAIRNNKRNTYDESVFSWQKAIDTIMNCVGV